MTRHRHVRPALVLAAAFAFVFAWTTAAQARVIPVRSTIQAAVDAARPGDVVLVPAGTYRENVAVSGDGISIVGRPGAVLDGTEFAGQWESVLRLSLRR